MKIVFIYGKPFSSALTKFFTGSTCYHVAFTDEKKLWDMNLIRRRRNWPVYPAENIILADLPAGCSVTAEYLDHQLDTDGSRYGVMDYLLFSVRWAYHLVGKSTRNAAGVICSEMVANDLAACGWPARFWLNKEVPSPADLELAIMGIRDAMTAKRLQAASVSG